MWNLLGIISKNFKLLIRSKVSALIVILGPLVLMLLVGLAFNTTSLNNVKIGVYSETYSELTETIVASLEDQQFKVVREESEIKCVQEVKTGQNHVCVVFPPNLEVKEEAEELENIVFHVDYSRINLVYQIIDSISEKISLKSSELSTAMTKVLLDTLENSKVKLTDNKAAVDSVKSANSQIKTDADNLISELPNLDVSTNQSSNLSGTLNDIKSGISECEVDLDDEIDDLEKAVSGVNSALSGIETVKSTLDTKSNAIKNSADENSGKIDTLISSLNSIVTEIEAIEITQAEKIVSPLRTQIAPIGEKKTNWNYLFPTLVMLIIMFVGIVLGSTLVIREKNSKAYFRNFITPTSDFTFLIGTYITALLIIFIQLLIIFGQAYYFLRQELLAILPLTALFLFIIASLFIFLGMFIGYIFKNEETSILGAISITFLLLFFSNTILPIETIPASLSFMALFNPFVISELILKRLVLFHAPLTTLLFSMYILLGYLASFFVLSFIMRELTKRRMK